VDFANLLTKKISLLICAHIIKKDEVQNVDNLKNRVETWLKDHNIQSFYTVVESDSFTAGVKYCISLTGLGKLSPNMVMLGFPSKKNDFQAIDDYVEVLKTLFRKKMSVGILRMKDGLTFSAIPETVVGETEIFQKKSAGFIDVWWLYDDGGLTLLLPYILQTRKRFKTCKLRIFSLAHKPDSFDKDTRNLAALLAKFRIDYSYVDVIPDITKKANAQTRAEFKSLLSEYPPGSITQAELAANAERTNRNLRLAELLQEKSANSELVVLSLPMPRQGQANPALYMAWLDIMTRNLPPTLLTRGNQNSVLTFYS
jgi:hypothetical protein